MFAHTHTHKHTQISTCMCGCFLIRQHIECKATRLIKELSAPSPIRFEITHEFNTRHQNGCQSIKLKSAHCVCVVVKTKVNTQLKHTEAKQKSKSHNIIITLATAKTTMAARTTHTNEIKGCYTNTNTHIHSNIRVH